MEVLIRDEIAVRHISRDLSVQSFGRWHAYDESEHYYYMYMYGACAGRYLVCS